MNYLDITITGIFLNNPMQELFWDLFNCTRTMTMTFLLHLCFYINILGHTTYNYRFGNKVLLTYLSWTVRLEEQGETAGSIHSIQVFSGEVCIHSFSSVT